MNTHEIESLLKIDLSDHEIVRVNTKDGVHFEALIVSALFEGESRLNRQRRVYSVLGALLQSGELHALALQTYTPAEWQIKEGHDR